MHHHQPEVTDLKLKYVGDIIMVKLSYDVITSNPIDGMGLATLPTALKVQYCKVEINEL